MFSKTRCSNFTKFTGKHLHQRLFFNNVTDLRDATLLRRKLWHKCFPVDFAKFLRTPYLQNNSGRLLLILFVACFLYFPLSKKFATKKVASCKKKSTSRKSALIRKNRKSSSLSSRS